MSFALVAFAGFGGEIFIEFALLLDKIVGIGRGVFLGRNIWPLFSIVTIDLEPFLQIGFGIRLDRFNRAFRLTHTAIDTLIRMDDEHVLAFVKTVDRAHFNAIRVFTLDAVLIDDIRHSSVSVYYLILAGFQAASCSSQVIASAIV